MMAAASNPSGPSRKRQLREDLSLIRSQKAEVRGRVAGDDSGGDWRYLLRPPLRVYTIECPHSPDGKQLAWHRQSLLLSCTVAGVTRSLRCIEFDASTAGSPPSHVLSTPVAPTLTVPPSVSHVPAHGAGAAQDPGHSEEGADERGRPGHAPPGPVPGDPARNAAGRAAAARGRAVGAVHEDPRSPERVGAYQAVLWAARGCQLCARVLRGHQEPHGPGYREE